MSSRVEFAESLPPALRAALEAAYASPGDGLAAAGAALASAGFPEEWAAKAAAGALARAGAFWDPSSPELYAGIGCPIPPLRLTEADLECLAGLSGRLPPDSLALLAAMAAWCRAFPHPSGWVRADSGGPAFLAGLGPAARERAMAGLRGSGEAPAMRVVGSNDPVPCMRIAWLADQPPAGPGNPLRDFGPMSRGSLRAALTEARKIAGGSAPRAEKGDPNGKKEES